MGEGIDEERAVEEHEGADEEAPDEQLRPGSAKPRSDVSEKGSVIVSLRKMKLP